MSGQMRLSTSSPFSASSRQNMRSFPESRHDEEHASKITRKPSATDVSDEPKGIGHILRSVRQYQHLESYTPRPAGLQKAINHIYSLFKMNAPFLKLFLMNSRNIFMCPVININISSANVSWKNRDLSTLRTGRSGLIRRHFLHMAKSFARSLDSFGFRTDNIDFFYQAQAIVCPFGFANCNRRKA
jgi:hypothetical protein